MPEDNRNGDGCSPFHAASCSRPGRFRKKPVEIEAMLLTEDSIYDVIRWAHEGMHPMMDSIIIAAHRGADIRTLEGTLHATWGDWIIKGVKGEFYPCKPDIFDATYDPVSENVEDTREAKHTQKIKE